MTLNLNQLSPAPWHHDDCGGVFETIVCPNGFVLSYDTHDDGVHGKSQEDMPFIALARNDLDVKQRRGWHTEKCLDADQWLVPQLVSFVFEHWDEDEPQFISGMNAIYQHGHDVGLLTKADAWFKENLEKRP